MAKIEVILRKFHSPLFLGLFWVSFSCFAQQVTDTKYYKTNTSTPIDSLVGTYTNVKDAQISFVVDADTFYVHYGNHSLIIPLSPIKFGNHTGYQGDMPCVQPFFEFGIEPEGYRYVTVALFDTSRYYKNDFVPFSHAHWTSEMNNTPKFASRVYAYHPLVVSGKLLLNAPLDIRKYLYRFSRRYGAVSDVKSYANLVVNKEFEYEIGGFHTASGKGFAHILIWQTYRGFKQRMFEFIAEKGVVSKTVSQEIDAARYAWLKLCNAHSPAKLVAECYTDDAIYYNWRGIRRGTEALFEEYEYMADPNYSLKLTPTHLELVSEKMVFEIGRCEGSYNLPYLLVWERQNDGQWKIYVDSNY